MNKILIITKDNDIGEQFQKLFGQSGFFAATVNGPQKMIEFCQMYTPNLIVIDVDQDNIWPSIHSVRTIRDLSKLPFVGISKIGAPQTLQTAQDYGFRGIMPVNAEPSVVINSCLLYTSPSPRDQRGSRMPSSA